jgi:hypothetical protein
LIAVWHGYALLLLCVGSLFGATFFAVESAFPAPILARLAFGVKVLLLLSPILVLSGRSTWFHPLVFIAFWAFAYELPPETQLMWNGLSSHVGLPGVSASESNQLLELKFGLDILAICCTYAGFLLLGRAALTIRLEHGSARILVPKTLLLILPALAGIFMLIRAAGSIHALALQRGLVDSERLTAQIGAHWHALATSSVPAVLFFAALHKRPARSPVLWMLLVFSTSAQFLVTGSRGGTLAIPILLLLVLFARSRRVPAMRVLVFAVVALIAVSVMHEFRNRSSAITEVSDFRSDKSVSERLRESVDNVLEYSTDASGLYPLLYSVPKHEPLQWGRTYLAIPAAPIPRAIWPQKPEGGGRAIATRFFNDPETTIPPTPVGEAFWNFHVVGVASIFLLWGMLLRLLWNVAINSAHSAPGVVILYLLTIYKLRPMTEVVYQWGLAFVPAVLMLVLLVGPLRFRRRVRPASEPDSTSQLVLRPGGYS